MGSDRIRDGLLLVQAGRLHFLVAGFLLYVIGALFAVRMGAVLEMQTFLLGYLICGTAHLSVSYSNDYYDRLTDDPAIQTRFSGGSGVLPVNPHLAGPVFWTAAILSLFSIGFTLLLVLIAGFPAFLIAFVAAGITLGWIYSAPPVRLTARGLGEVATMAAFGIFLPGGGYLFTALQLAPEMLWLMIPLFFLGLFFIVSVELPDFRNDAATGKKTLVVRAGRKQALRIAALGAAATTFAFCILAVSGPDSGQFFTVAAFASGVPLLFGIAAVHLAKRDGFQIEKITEWNMRSLILFLCILTGYLVVWP
ncbi:MAG: prenyltransferase [Methanocalculus sp. MSAO_Arc1]|uniref:prenyltransferase n=1 Tax=Methanocalculus TaxID=71151 RepID=UPI000FF1F24F|nr:MULTISPECIES: prenyltransferase [unclassified Methanocalculus]MCP1662153.1 1,4-dihydroxy-2-naphthoate octaprenyltransferase [Methanocalculus sp. AMF5]RQD79116.1 MAG: prenyltransferase [Methanocalculus sp. MSAO_Arc1]